MQNLWQMALICESPRPKTQPNLVQIEDYKIEEWTDTGAETKNVELKFEENIELKSRLDSTKCWP